MRTLFFLLVVANLIAFAAQFAVIREIVSDRTAAPRPAQLLPERLRIIRDTSARPARPTGSAPANPAYPASGTNN